MKDYRKINERLEAKLIDLVRDDLILENSYIMEGIDIDITDKTVTFNDNHEDNVDTSILLNPTYYKYRDCDVISIFKRKQSVNYRGYDGNPLVYALKGLKGWKFKNDSLDTFSLLKRFVKICNKIDKKFDTIITIPSSNPLNTHFLHGLNKIIKCDNKIDDYFIKLNSDEVLNDYYDFSRLRDDSIRLGVGYEKLKNKVIKAFDEMYADNNSVFSYKYFHAIGDSDISLRDYVIKSMKSSGNELKYSDMINDKNILILDDTISRGNSIVESSEDILDTFTPKSTTIITLFSALNI